MNLKKWLAGALSALMLLAPVLPQPTYADTTLLELQILQQAHAEIPAENVSVPETVQKETTAVKKEALPEVSAAQSAEVYGAAEVLASGTCGENLTWTLTGDGVLTISGTGAMADYADSSDVPWKNYSSDITSVVMVNGVTSIGSYAFYNCSSLPSIVIPSSVTSIGDDAFRYCRGLTSIKIPDRVTSIGESAFYYCSSLTSITMSSSVTSIGDYAFCGCSGLKSITIPSGMTYIGNSVFYSCISLTSVMLPESVTSIGWYAFSGCSSLTSITIPSGVTSIADYAFFGCRSLTSVTFTGNKPGINSNVFFGVTATVYYPMGNDTWTDSVKQNYGGTLTWVAVCMNHNYENGSCTICGAEDPDRVIASGWSGATQWTLTAGGILTFTGSGNMKNYGYNRNQPWLSYADQITSVVVEDGVAAIGTGAFMDLTKLESVTLPTSGLKTIGKAAFYGCTALKEIAIPDGVYTVWEYTFKNCTSLTEVRFPETLIKIDQGAFENCTALTQLALPKDTGIIGAWSFKGCTGLEKADMSASAATEIRAGAFKNCSSLTTILLPKNIQKLGDSCFYGIGATSFTVPSTVTTIEAWCFARAKLTSIIFEGDAPIIGEGAFNKITLTAAYDSANTSWDADVMQNYGGTVTWQAQ